MKLEKQIEILTNLGLPLNNGISVEDFLISADREEYESNVFDSILFTFGIEVEEAPWGRNYSDFVWNFDVECIYDSGDYISIVDNFYRLTNKTVDVTDITDFVDLDSEEAWLEYTVDGKKKHFDIEVDNDWADPKVVEEIMKDVKEEGYDFFGKDNGQATVWFYMTPENAKKLNDLADDVFGLKKSPRWKIW